MEDRIQWRTGFNGGVDLMKVPIDIEERKIEFNGGLESMDDWSQWMIGVNG